MLSEFAGAAAELNGAVVVNPYDIDGVADSVQCALLMSPEERRARMRTLRRRVRECDVHAWVQSFIGQLDAPSGITSAGRDRAPSLATAIHIARERKSLRLLLDYDGTLVPLARAPELAAPDRELLRLLSDLAATPDIRVDIVSGRPHRTLEEWFGALPLCLWAEHGFWLRPEPSAPWQAAGNLPSDLIAALVPILEQFVASTPGSRLECTTASLAWHYRSVQRDFGARQAHELRMLLGDVLSNQPFEVLEGKKVAEVRLRGVNKDIVARRVFAECSPDMAVIAIGDDRTDEELFRALAPPHLTIAVGRSSTAAAFRVDDHRVVRRILRSLVVDTAARGDSRHDSDVWDGALA